MRISIKERLAAGQMVRVFSVGQIASPKWIEIAALHGGYHAVWIDQEHAGLTQSRIEILTLACRSVGLDAYVRVAPTDYATLMRPMEAGAGVMAAQLRTVAEAKQVVAWSRFPPLGIRGLNLSNHEGRYALAAPAEHVERSNRERWVAVQIETREAVECVDEIAAIEGIDHLFVGPADLSLSLGVPGEYLHERCVAALERVSQAAQATGKSWGALVLSKTHADTCRALGCQLFAFASDLSLIHRGFQATRNLFDDFFHQD